MSGLRWTFWHIPRGKKVAADMLVNGIGQPWAEKYALTLWGVAGCLYAGEVDGLPSFEVPGHGRQVLNLEQARYCRIVRMTEIEAGSGGVRRAREAMR